MQRLATAVLGVLLAAVLLVAAVSAAVRFTATSGWWWERGFARFDAERRTGLPAEEVLRIGAEVREYLVDDSERLAVTYRVGEREVAFFSEREVQHMVDVKVLMERTWVAGLVAAGVLVLALVGAILLRRFGRGTVAMVGGAIGVAVIAVLAVVAVAGFDGAFRQFHLLFFTNDLWQLTSRDRLIQLFPQQFFFETTLVIGGAAVAASLLCLAAGVALRRRRGGGAA